MKRLVKIQVDGLFDGAPRATLEIDRVAQLASLRPLRRRKVYTLPLSEVAEHILWKVARLEAEKGLSVKRKRKPVVRRGLQFK